MRGGGGDPVEDLAARGRAAHQIIPHGFPEQTIASREHPATTGVWEAFARIRYGRGPCGPLLDALELIVRGLTSLSDPAGETARLTARNSCVFLGNVGGLAGVVRCALFRRVAYRARRCHQACEGNADRSTHGHGILLARHPLAVRNNLAVPCQ